MLTMPLSASAGVVIGGLRFIYPAGQKNSVVALRNTGEESFLVQTKILADDGVDSAGLLTPTTSSGGVPFIATPPLWLMKGQTETQLRITWTGNALPEDRESLFWLSVAAIPSTKPVGDSHVVLAFRQRVKLIWRPEAVKESAQQAGEKLHWQRHHQQVTVRNDSARYITFSAMTVNGSKMIGGMIPPFAKRQQSWCPASGKCTLSWTPLGDSGEALARQHVTFE